MRKRWPLEERFVQGEPDECWPWLGPPNKVNGYGQFVVRKDGRAVSKRAHRAVYELLVGPIPEGLELDHLCRNRLCVNPAHLEPVTRAENVRRAMPYLRRGEDHHHGAKTHCPQGHEYTPENTYVSEWNRRYCRACSAMRNEARLKKRSA